MLSFIPLLLAGCLKTPGTPENFVVGESATPTPLSELCDDPDLTAESFCMATDIELVMRDAPIRFLSGEVFGGGASGIMKMQVELAPENGETLVIDTKWKPGPEHFSGLNNSPRKEVAAFHVQKLFLEPSRWVAPPTVMRCVEPVQGVVKERSGGKDLDCVWGVLSQWVDNLEAPEEIDLERFENDLAYRTAIADLNLFMYVISHRDTHAKNWYVSTDPEHVRAASVDNGVAFSGFKNFITSIDWGDIHVPALAADSVERLRHIEEDDLEHLRVLGAWNIEDRLLKPAATGPAPKFGGVRYEDGMLVHGLSSREVRKLHKRIRKLVEDVDAGKIPVFDPAAIVADAE